MYRYNHLICVMVCIEERLNGNTVEVNIYFSLC